jgi:hypothetical protein
VGLCRRCLSPERADRPADAGEVAVAVASLRAAADERARRAELDRAAAVLKAAEQRKRRRVQVALVGAWTSPDAARDFPPTPIVADSLRDAGCEIADVLAHTAVVGCVRGHDCGRGPHA